MPRKTALPKFETTNECIVCGNLYTNTSNNRATKSTCRKCISFLKRSENKKRAIEYKGGKCFRCGYNKCEASMCFHHFIGYTSGFFTEEEKERYKKKYSITNIMECSWKKIQAELDKCVLLCQNDHAELHFGMWSMRKEDLNLK